MLGRSLFEAPVRLQDGRSTNLRLVLPARFPQVGLLGRSAKIYFCPGVDSWRLGSNELAREIVWQLHCRKCVNLLLAVSCQACRKAALCNLLTFRCTESNLAGTLGANMQERPALQVTHPIQHPWVNNAGRMSFPSLDRWNPSHSRLAPLFQEAYAALTGQPFRSPASSPQRPGAICKALWL